MKKYPLPFLLYCCTVSLSLFAQEEQRVFQHFDVNNSNLPQGQVLSIMEDSYGLLWISTMDGLAKFDGYQFHAIPNPDGISVTSNYIIEDSIGNLWIDSKSSLLYYDRSKKSFKKFIHEPDNPCSLPAEKILSICLDHNGDLWIGMVGHLVFFDVQKEEFHNIPLECFSSRIKDRTFIVHDILEDRKGNIWAASTHGLLKIDEEPTNYSSYNAEKFRSGSKNTYANFQALYEDRHGRLWVGCSDGLRLWQPESEDFQYFSLEEIFPTSTASIYFIRSRGIRTIYG